MELPAFKAEVLAANQARVGAYGGRIAPEDIQGRRAGVELPMLISDIHDLGVFMTSTGAYDHPDGTPVTPPPTPSPGPTPTPSQYTGYLTGEIPPCTSIEGATVDPCKLDAEPFHTIIAHSHPELDDEPTSIREMLSYQPGSAMAPHLVVRGTYVPGTARCTAGDRYRPPNSLVDEWDERSFKCYLDVRANDYILGSGPPTLTVLMYIDYVYSAHAEDGQTAQDRVDNYTQRLEIGFRHLLPGREHVIFIGPPADLSSEAWRFMGYWDVQRREDGTVVAVHIERDDWRYYRPDDYLKYRSVLEMELPALKEVVTAANQARVSEYGGRIGADESLPMLVTDANNLRQYYTEVGAFDHPDGTPVPPPVAD